MNPNNELDRQRFIKAIENSPHPTPPPGRRARKMGGGHTHMKLGGLVKQMVDVAATASNTYRQMRTYSNDREAYEKNRERGAADCGNEISWPELAIQPLLFFLPNNGARTAFTV